jgi:hypothetical protein
LLARVQTTTPILADQAWVLVMGGVALLAGGFLAWLGNMGSRTQGGLNWPAFAVHQTGYVLAFIILLSPSLPWPLISLSLSLGLLAIWWDMNPEAEADTPVRRLQWIGQRLEPWWEGAQASMAGRVPTLERWRNSWLVRRGTALVPIAALVSLVGAPFTAGVVGRWALYATLLHKREATLLIITLVADTLLSAGLWLALGIVLKQASDRRPKGMALIAMIPLAIVLIALGIAPNKLIGSTGLRPPDPPDVSVWGLGFIFVLPWLVGGWLARVGSRMRDFSASAQRVIDLSWLYRATTWLGQRLAAAVGWLGQIGEGDGWWGWALIILAIGAMFLLAR